MKALAIAVLLIAGSQCVSAQAVAPREYPPGREPYYYGSDNTPWYDSYGRLRYGPQGVPARQYEEQRAYETRRLEREFPRQAPPVQPVQPERGIEPVVIPSSN